MQSLSIQKRLRRHSGCVNTISFNSDGRFLLSGADDRNVVLWNWVEAAPTFSFHSGHSNNVLHAQFMSFSNDRSIVTCAADGEVCIHDGTLAVTSSMILMVIVLFFVTKAFVLCSSFTNRNRSGIHRYWKGGT